VKSKFRLILALVLALTLSGGVYAYTYLIASATISIAEPTGDIVTCNATETQPDWESILTPTASGTETLRPNDAGTYSQCDPVGDSPNYRCVDEEVADGDATYVMTSGGATEIDTYNIPDHSEDVGDITSVTVYVRSKGTSTDYLHAAQTVIRTQDTDYFGSYTLLPVTYTNFSTTYDLNPYTTNAWTWDEIDALEIGVRQYDQGGGYASTTQVYAEIDWEVIPLKGEVPTGDLFEVNTHADYSGDLTVKVSLTNAGDLTKAYQYLNMELYLEDSVEAGKTPNYRLLTLQNAMTTFSLENGAGDNHTLSVIGGGYGLNSYNPLKWEEGWAVTPELYCRITQR